MLHFNKSVVTSLVVALVIILISVVAILYGKGYRLSNDENGNRIIQGTGLLVLTSKPDGARVLIDGNLTTATNDTINLEPGEYNVRIEKDGFFAWTKNVVIKKEAVTQTDALLFPSASKLEAVTAIGAENPVIDPTGRLIAYTVASSSAKKNGIYILSLTNRPLLPIGTSITQIASDTFDDFSKASVEFSPNGNQLLSSIESESRSVVYLLNTDELNSNPQNVTITVDQIRNEWELEKQLEAENAIESLPKKVRVLASENFKSPLISTEGNKILYIASKSASIPLVIDPPLPSTNSTIQTRNLIEGSYYVYQAKEDKNYLLYEPVADETPPQFIWHPSNNHLLFIQNNEIRSIEFDGGNETTLYAGPFDGKFIYPWPDGSGIVILTNLNDVNSPPNLYRLGLK